MYVEIERAYSQLRPKTAREIIGTANDNSCKALKSVKRAIHYYSSAHNRYQDGGDMFAGWAVAKLFGHARLVQAMCIILKRCRCVQNYDR